MLLQKVKLNKLYENPMLFADTAKNQQQNGSFSLAQGALVPLLNIRFNAGVRVFAEDTMPFIGPTRIRGVFFKAYEANGFSVRNV